MAGTISSLGVGSNLDAATIVSSLMAIERQPLNALKTKESSFNAKLSAYGTLKSALSTLQTAAKALTDASKVGGFGVTVGDSKILGATAAFNASPGTYSIHVGNLATAQKNFSSPINSGQSFGSGTLTFNIGGNAKNIDIADGSSINDIRSAINAANMGVTATVISGSGGDRLVLSSTDTGTANAFSLTVASADANLQALATANSDATLSVAAKDANLTIDGVAVTSSSNTLTSALTGITLNLTAPGDTTITVTKDTSKTADAVNAFVKAYNDVISQMKTLTAYDVNTKTGAALNGEGTIRSIQSMLNNARLDTPADLAGSSSLYKSLSALGIAITQDGSLQVDNDKLTTALNTSAVDVTKTLGAFGQAMSDQIDNIIGAKGILANRTDGINSTIKTLQNNQTSMQARLDKIQARYEAQFTALDTLMSGLNRQSNYMTNWLSSLNGGNK
ncbi:MAG: flagellar filament capping protein FliD [Azonexus sp.]|jgi:flagellar hook-associated protein 2|nr:flagellar filament capping protein FliD [Azonexus sp.]